MIWLATPIITESRYFEEKVKRKGFFQKWNDDGRNDIDIELAQVGQVEQVEAGLQIYVGQVGQEQGGLQIDMEQVGQEQGVCPAEPLHLTQMELSGREKFITATTTIRFVRQRKFGGKISWKVKRYTRVCFVKQVSP